MRITITHNGYTICLEPEGSHEYKAAVSIIKHITGLASAHTAKPTAGTGLTTLSLHEIRANTLAAAMQGQLPMKAPEVASLVSDHPAFDMRGGTAVHSVRRALQDPRFCKNAVGMWQLAEAQKEATK